MPLDTARCSRNKATKFQKKLLGLWLVKPQKEFLSEVLCCALESCGALGIRCVARLLTALQNDVTRREVKLSLTGCGLAEGQHVKGARNGNRCCNRCCWNRRNRRY